MGAGLVGNRDIIVIGASLGGVAALQELFSSLPEDLPAAVFVVLHTHPWSASSLPEILSHRGPLRATHAIHGERIKRGHVYVAPPDNQLMLHSSMLHVVRGPRENNHRPAVDALFRTASKYHGPRVIGVVLTGTLDCGTAGMLSIKSRNGLAVVQDPSEAVAADMPRSVVRHVQVDHVLALAEIGPLLNRLAREPAAEWPAGFSRPIAELEGDELGLAVQVVCPHCTGPLTLTQLNGFNMFRCHTGHTFSELTVMGEQDDQVERALWSAVRALAETATIAGRLAAGATGDMRVRYAEKAASHTESADQLRSILLNNGPKIITPPEDPDYKAHVSNAPELATILEDPDHRAEGSS